MKKRKINLLIIALVLAVGLLSVAYAFFNYYKEGANQKLISGEIYLKFKDNTDSISLSNIYPETKEVARSRTDNVITFTVSGISTVTNKDVYYEVYLNEGEKISGMTRFKPEHIVFDLVEIDEDGNRTMVIDAMSFSDFNKKRIWVNTVNRNSTINKTYELRMWLSEDVLISDTESNASYTTSQFENSYISIKVGVFGDFVEKELGLLIKKIENTLPLTEADSDGIRFVYGSDVDNNYVWYSGKLWRIVSIDSDGDIKLVTQGNMTSVAWDTSSSNTDYSTSQIRSWLNDEFLPTLYDADNLLVDHEWDYTTYGSFPTEKLETTSSVTERVGLLNVYEFMMTGGTNSYNTTKTFLNNGYYWWTMSPKTSSYVWYVSEEGSVSSYNPTDRHGARPSVNLKSGIIILGGTGEKTNPYTIEGDKTTGTTSELLSNRISGEYINFNNTKYRIVGIEEVNGQQLTKVTMADYDVNNNTLSTSVAFGESDSDVTYNTSTGIGKYMYDWYQADSTSETYADTYIEDTYKTMIATDGIEWYTGAASGSYDYTLSKTGTTVATPIGLGYYGEMFSSQFGEGYDSSTVIWLMTKYADSYVWYVYTYGYINISYGPTDSLGARPSFYLKSEVKITGGTGQPGTPYEISQ